MKRLSPRQMIRRENMRRQRQRMMWRRRMRVPVPEPYAPVEAIRAIPRYFTIPRRRRRISIRLPAVLSLRDNYSATIQAIESLRAAALIHNFPVMLYFDDVKSIEPAATLVLAAEIERCQKLRPYLGDMLVNGTYPADMDVLLQLQEMGFYNRIGVPDLDLPSAPETTNRPRFLKSFSFSEVESEVASILTDVVSIGAFAMSDQLKGRMTGALKEAMGNAVEHAYRKKGYLPCLERKWWGAAYVAPEAGEMMIILFDQGVGVPQTLDADLFDLIVSMVTTRSWGLSDGYMIAAATELYRTSTGQKGRGKGFRDMKKFIDSCDDGELKVLSNRGSYRYMKGGEEIADESASIGGTLVEWRVRHGKPVDFEDA